MENRWNEEQADKSVAAYRERGVPEELALRVYSSRLIGGDPSLVLHGGGNTSVKGRARDLSGAEGAVLYVKGSGWDLATIEPPGFPAVRLDPIRALRRVEHLSDEEMVNALRTNLLDASAPNPSVEALLHAFLPHRFVDHTHADAVLALVDQPDPEALCAHVFGGRLAVLPFVFPGYALAGRAMAAFEADPEVEGIVLVKHGLFTFGETAQESYDRMIHYVSLAEEALIEKVRTGEALPASAASGAAEAAQIFLAPRADERARNLGASADGVPAAILPVLRGALAEPDPAWPGGRRRWILHHRTSRAIRAFVDGAELEDYACRGVATPDHIIRTKNLPLILPPGAGENGAFAGTCRERVRTYREAYREYFARNAARSPSPKEELDRTPRIVLVPGVGIIAVGATEGAARIAADLYEHTVDIITKAEGLGRYTPLEESELFEMEYWSLEQAKLGKKPEPLLARHVVLVTGAASGIGAATAEAFAGAGAHLVLVDRDQATLEGLAERLTSAGHRVLAVACDVTDPGRVAAAFEGAVLRFGGVDLVISNAGGVWQSPMADCGEAALRESFEINFFAHQFVAAAAVRVFRAQGTGGHLLFSASKSAFNPGAGLGPYTLPKAALVALMKQYAVDYGEAGIRSNAVNADRVHTGLFADGVLEARAQARGVTVGEYLSGNLLGAEVRAEDVARAFVMLACSERTTGTVFPVDGGNIAAAPR